MSSSAAAAASSSLPTTISTNHDNPIHQKKRIAPLASSPTNQHAPLAVAISTPRRLAQMMGLSTPKLSIEDGDDDTMEEKDLTCCGAFPLNEFLLVYLALAYASFIGPVSTLSFVYFVCLLVATPLYAYYRWIPFRVRRRFCVALVGMSSVFLLFQGSMTLVVLAKEPDGKGVRGVMEALSIHRHISFFLFSFITCDAAVLLTALLAIGTLKAKERQGMRHVSSASTSSSPGSNYSGRPAHIFSKNSFLGKNWRASGLMLLLASSVIYPSLLSLPFYLAYLVTFGAWSLGFFATTTTASSATTTSATAASVDTGSHTGRRRDYYTLWETLLACSGAAYVAIYLAIIYVFQMTAVAQRVDVEEFRRYGIMNVVAGHDSAPPLTRAQTAVFALHVSCLFFLYLMATSVVTCKALNKGWTSGSSSSSNGSTLLQVQPQNHAALAGSGRGGAAGGHEAHLITVDLTNEEPQQRPAAGRARATSVAATAISNTQVFAQWLVAKYGLYLCFVCYIILALQRPTILGFVFMTIVMLGAVLPNFVFHACAPVLLIYTSCYAAVVYWFGSVGIRNGYFAANAEKVLTPIGLVEMDPFRHGWLVAGVPLVMVTLLGCTWHFRDWKTKMPAAASLLSSTSMGKEKHRSVKSVEWVQYLEDYLVAHNLGLYLCLQLCFAVGVSAIDIYHFPFVAVAAIMIVFPITAPYLWVLVVGYTQGFVLYQYWLNFQSGDAFGLSDMVLPVVFFVFACRQFIVYVHAWRQQYQDRQQERQQRQQQQQEQHGTLALRDGAAHAHSSPASSGIATPPTTTTAAATSRSRAASLRPSSRHIRAVKRVNGGLYVAKIILRFALVGLVWHLAFHAPLTIFSAGYLVLLAVLPLVFVWSTSFNTTSRRAFPRLFRAMAIYAGIVLCFVHIFCTRRLTGISVDSYIGSELGSSDKRAVAFMALNWIVQFLAATQTEILRQQDVNMAEQFRGYPLFLHSVKQVLPFILVLVIFGFTWRYISLFGAVILYLGILNAVLGRKILLVWRAMVILSILIALAIAVFDFGYFDSYATSPLLYWIGLRRGHYVPSPDGSDLPEGAKGWLLSPSAEAYLVIAFLSALQFFYNTGTACSGDDETMSGNDDAGAAAHKSKAADVAVGFSKGPTTSPASSGFPPSLAPAGADDLDGLAPSPSAPPSAEEGEEPVIDNTSVIVPGLTRIIEILYGGFTGMSSSSLSQTASTQGETTSELQQQQNHEEEEEEEGEEEDTQQQQPSAAKEHKAQPSKTGAAVLQSLSDVYRLLHGLFLKTLSLAIAFSFELCAIWAVIAALFHADLISLLYMAFFLVLVSFSRSFLKYHWGIIIHSVALLVMAEYMFILRLPPELVPDSASPTVAKFLGSRECSIFAQYTTPQEQAGSNSYTYGQWFGLCITQTMVVLLDFVMLVLVIIQNKRFKADPRSTLRINRPLFASVQLAKTNPEKPVEADATTNRLALGRFLVLEYSGYLIVLVIIGLSTLTFNLTSLGYLVLVALMVQTHAQEGVLTRRRYMWTRIAMYAWFCLLARLLYQIPDLPVSLRTDSASVLLGLRKVHGSMFSSNITDYSPEMIFDAAILILIVLQRRIFLSEGFQSVIDELWYAEQYDYLAHGCHVVNQLEKIREDAMVRIRKQIRTMYEQLDTVARARMEEADNKSWEHYLLKNRNAALSPRSQQRQEEEEQRQRVLGLGQSSSSDDVDDEDQDYGGVDAAAVAETEAKQPLLSSAAEVKASSSPAPVPPPVSATRESSTGWSRQESLLRLHAHPYQSSLGYDGAGGPPPPQPTSTPASRAQPYSAPQPRRLTLTSMGGATFMDESMDEGFFQSGGGGGRTTLRSATSLTGAGPGNAGRTSPQFPLSKRSTLTPPPVDGTRPQPGRSVAGETGNIANWLSEALNQSTILQMKDPLLITDADVNAAAAAHAAETRARTPTRLLALEDEQDLEGNRQPLSSNHHRRVSSGQQRQTFVFSPVLADMANVDDMDITIDKAASPPGSRRTEGGGGARLPSPPLVVAPSSSSSPPRAQAATAAMPRPSSPPPAASVATFVTSSHLERLLEESFRDLQREESVVASKQATAAAAGEDVPRSPIVSLSLRIHKTGLQLLRNLVLFFNSRSTSIVYTVMVIAHMYEPSLLNLIYPVSVFGYALVQNPRSLPRIGGSLIHPMIQNPPRYFWHFLLGYAFFMLVIKFIFQFPYFCICGNHYSYGRHCPSSLVEYQDVCVTTPYPHLDYFIDQPIVADYFVGLFKAYKALSWNQMSVRFEPVDRFVPADVPGTVSETTLESGLRGAFMSSFVGDFLVLLAVLWHTHVLKIRGVWLSRDPDFLAQGAEGEGGSKKGEEKNSDNNNNTSNNNEEDGGANQQQQQQEGEEQDDEEVNRPRETITTNGITPTTAKSKLPSFLAAFFCCCLPSSKTKQAQAPAARAKPGCDLYVSMFFIQVLLFIFVVLGYQQAERLFQSVRENQLSGGFILVLLLHFVLIVADRCLYLHRSIKGKFILQIVLILCIYYILHSGFTFRIGINQHGPIFAWYLIMCAYLFVSALQISYGYPPFIQTNWMTKRAHHFWGNIFRLYRAVPFLYELRMLLDWTCTPTTLYLGEWIKMEDIYCGLFIIECNLDFMRLENRKKGDRQPARRKWLCGFLFFALLNLLVWLPLFVFSTGSLSQFENYVKTGSLSVQLNGFPMLYEAASADYISPLLPQETWSALAQQNPGLALLPATSTNDYMKELQYVRFPQSSQELWKISPPAEADLLSVLEGAQDNDTAATTAAGSAAAVVPKQVEMTMQFAFATEDGSFNEGSLVHPLTAMERQQMAEIIRGTRTSLRIVGILPSIIRISSTREVTPLLDSGDIRSDCSLTFTKMGDQFATNGTDPADITTPSDNGNVITTAAVGWWDLRCGNSQRGTCSTPLEPPGPEAATISLDPVTGEPEPGCNPSAYTISSEKTIGSYFAITYGIIGLYFTVVFTIGRFVHMSVMNKKYGIICDDLPRIDVLKELCETIYLARMYKNLPLEEELYRELIDVYRRPELIYQRTGPYRHWLRELDEEQTDYDRIVEKELERYR